MEKLYLDTNCFYFFFFIDDKYHNKIVKLFVKINNGEIQAFTSSATLEELAYVALMRLIEKKFNKHPKDVLRDNPGIVSELSQKIEEMFTVIFSFNNLEIVDLSKADISLIPFMMKDYSLLPRDSLHVITMSRLNCKKIISTDGDFDTVKNIQRLDPAYL